MKYKWLIAASLFICIIVTANIFFSKKLTVESSFYEKDEELIFLENKVLRLPFSEKLNKETVNEHTIFVTDEEGNKVETKIKFADDHQTVLVLPPDDGYESERANYYLHIKDEIRSVSGKKLSNEKKISFTVKENLPVIGSSKELKDYFQNLLDEQEKAAKKAFRFGVKEETVTLESANSAQDSSAGAGGGMDVSSTNIQVAGVDESDIVKTNGDYIYKVADQKVYVIEVNSGETLNLIKTIKYEHNFYPYELFLHEDRLVVIGHTYEEIDYSYQSSAEMPAKRAIIAPMSYGTKAIVYNVSNPDNIFEERSVSLEGNIISTRKVNNFVYIVTNQYPNYWLLREEPETELRPVYFDSTVSNTNQYVDYDKISYFPDSQESNYTLIGTIDLNDPTKEMAVTTYLGSGNLMYMSKENLYLAVQNFAFMPLMIGGGHYETPPTTIYKFSIDELNVSFHSSTEVEGRILNQFSMDEHNGYFRVATTKGQVWDDERPSSNHLFIFDEHLKLVSSLDGLARGERIYSARFMGEKIYIVTFRETDPLFVIDAKDPANPQVLGELKIPGFSNYLHPIDENHLVGFGYDTKAVPTKDGREPMILTEGIKLSLFDVSNMSDPKEKFTEIIGGRGTYSPLNYNHKALLYHPVKQLFAFPITVYENVEGTMYDARFVFQGAYVYNVDVNTGFQLQTKITHMTGKEPYEEWEKEIERLLYINDKLYALSRGNVTVISLDDYRTLDSLMLD